MIWLAGDGGRPIRVPAATRPCAAPFRRFPNASNGFCLSVPPAETGAARNGGGNGVAGDKGLPGSLNAAGSFGQSSAERLRGLCTSPCDDGRASLPTGMEDGEVGRTVVVLLARLGRPTPNEVLAAVGEAAGNARLAWEGQGCLGSVGVTSADLTPDCCRPRLAQLCLDDGLASARPPSVPRGAPLRGIVGGAAPENTTEFDRRIGAVVQEYALQFLPPAQSTWAMACGTQLAAFVPAARTAQRPRPS